MKKYLIEQNYQLYFYTYLQIRFVFIRFVEKTIKSF